MEKKIKIKVGIYKEYVDIVKAFAIKAKLDPRDFGLLINRIIGDNLEGLIKSDPLIEEAIKNKLYDMIIYECDKDIKRESQSINFKHAAKKSLIAKLSQCYTKEEFLRYIDKIKTKSLRIEDPFVNEMLDLLKNQVQFCKSFREVKRKSYKLLGGKTEHEQLPPPSWSKGE